VSEGAAGIHTRDRFDAVSLEIAWKRLISIVDQMAATLKRTSFSPLVREGNDFSCILLGADASSAVQSTLSTPSFLGTLPYTVEQMFRQIPRETLVPGDVLVTNDPWIGTGHLLDVSVATPIFQGERLIAFFANAAHVPDIGGIGFAATGSDVQEEGLLIPVCRLYHGGEPNQDVANFIRYNVRVPDLVLGDIEAQVAANHAAGRLLEGFLAESGVDLATLIAAIQKRSERALRSAIRTVPEGVYRSELTSDGCDGPVMLRCRVRVSDETLEVDYAGSSPQSPRGINSVLAYTRSYTMYGLKCMLDPLTPNNAGCLRPIRITAPGGSVLNPRWPAATLARHVVGNLLPSVIFAALAPVCPDRVLADSGSAPIWPVRFDGTDAEGRAFTLTLQYSGGQGGRPGKPGLSAVSFPANASNTPVEVLESISPLSVVEKALISGSGGAGQFRGGDGQRVAIRSRASGPLKVSVLGERVRYPAMGAMGGSPGRPGFVWSDGMAHPSKALFTLLPGGTLVLETPGGGGLGVPEGGAP
jgi:N-methylhydantoinase B